MKTAVEYFYEKVIDLVGTNKLLDEAFTKAKQLEKQQIIDSCNQTEFEDEDGFGICETLTKGEQYFNETFK